MTEITQADRDAAAVFYGTWGGTKGWQHLEEPIRKGLVDDNALVRAFARHRQQAIEQLEREKAVVYDLWEQQKEIALGYLTDCNKASERIEALRLAVVHYDAALKSSWPYGAKGDAWEHWNEARIILQDAGQPWLRTYDAHLKADEKGRQ